MKTHYILTSALSLAIVGGALIAPSAFAWDKSSATEGIDYLVNKAYWGSNPKPKDTFGYVSVVEVDIYNEDYSEIIGVEYILISSPNGSDSEYCYSWRISYSSSGHSTYYNRGKFHVIKNAIQEDFWDLWRDNTIVGAIGMLSARYSGNHRVISDISRMNINLQIDPLFDNSLVHFINDYGQVSEIGQNIANEIDNPPHPPTTEPYTDSAPGFPNLPNNWVNPDFTLPDINIPDLDINIEIPEFTYPTQPQISEDVENGIGGIGKIIYDFLNGTGLLWLCGVMLFLWLLCYILGR